MQTENSKEIKDKISLKNAGIVAFRAFALTFKLLPSASLGLMFIFILSAVLPLAQNGVFSIIINNISDLIGQNAPEATAGMSRTILFFILLYVGVTIISSITKEFSKFVAQRWNLLADYHLNIYTTRKRAGIDIAQYENPDFQNLMYRAFESGIWPIYKLARGQIDNISNMFGIIAASLIVYSISPTLLIICIVSAIPSFIVELKYGNIVWGIWAENSPRQRLYYALREHINTRRNVVQTKMLQATNKILSIIEGIATLFLNEQLAADKKKLILGTLAGTFMAAGMGYGFYLIIQDVLWGSIKVGTLVFAVTSLQSLVNDINLTLRDIAGQYKDTLQAKDIFKILDTNPIIQESANAVALKNDKPPVIEFKNVSFKYPSGKKSGKGSDTNSNESGVSNENNNPYVFKDLNFKILPGEKIGLVGQNGAGKSTLIKLLMRVYDPTEGVILVNGTDLKDIKLDDWTSTLSVLLQQYSLHELNVGEAIAMGAPNEETNIEQVIHSAKMSGADEFIHEYPKKYEQQISREFDDGIEPSQGQLQKIALARSLYRLKIGQVLILDEPTAAIDPVAEQEIFEQMEHATAGKTLILITHRFNSVKNVDRILVLDGHLLVEEGNHTELMKKGGLYAKMFNSQAKGFIEGSK
jgi:ATP-binding cassette, subfamily B, bacterial